MDQHEVATELAIAQSTYCDWEKGNMKPRKERLKAIAAVLRVREAQLLQWWLAS